MLAPTGRHHPHSLVLLLWVSSHRIFVYIILALFSEHATYEHGSIQEWWCLSSKTSSRRRLTLTSWGDVAASEGGISGKAYKPPPWQTRIWMRQTHGINVWILDWVHNIGCVNGPNPSKGAGFSIYNHNALRRGRPLGVASNEPWVDASRCHHFHRCHYRIVDFVVFHNVTCYIVSPLSCQHCRPP